MELRGVESQDQRFCVDNHSSLNVYNRMAGQQTLEELLQNLVYNSKGTHQNLTYYKHGKPKE